MDPTALSPYTAIEQGTALPALDLGFLMPLIVISLVVTVIISVAFIIYLILSAMRRQKLQQATLDMQKDIRRIRELMEQGTQLNRPTQSDNSPTTSRSLDKLAYNMREDKNPAESPDVTQVESQSRDEKNSLY